MDLDELARRLAQRKPARTEANVQSDLHTLLVAAPLDLADPQLEDIVLESPAGQRRRIDVEVGSTVFEVKRDLRTGNVRADAVEQLAGYVVDRQQSTGTRYVGVLTDGAEWHLYHLKGSGLQLVSTLELDPNAPDPDALCVWLEAVLATQSRIGARPREIVRRLGAGSPGHRLDFADLKALYEANASKPTVALKRQLWAKLLTTALGTNFTNEDDLFIEHTLLVITAEVIGHAVVGIDPGDPTVTPATLLAGRLFSQRSQITGVVEADFFDWVIEVDGGDGFVRTLARRLTRFAWDEVEHDVMKVLYESIIDADERHSLGEYYTPDWLADEIVRDVVAAPLQDRVLDPACGSGTFLFHAVRRYLAAADASGLPNAEAVRGVTNHVIGVDVHPVAVTLARVTYLLAIGTGRLSESDRPPIAIPVYLGDTVQWGQQVTLFSSQGLTVPTNDGAALFAEELQFPSRLLEDAGRFDELVSKLADMATDRQTGSGAPSLSAIFRLFAVQPDDQATVTATFELMCRLHDEGRDHIWGYYVRNLARPVWLSQSPNRVDVLVGNPPWLAFRYMTEGMQAEFRDLSAERDLWHGTTVATHQDLSGLFVARCVELYLKDGGRFGFVMPLAALTRRQFAGFRAGSWPSKSEPAQVTFGQPWDLHKVKPSFFPVPASVVFGSRTQGVAVALPSDGEQWSGRVKVRNASRAEALPQLTRAAATTQVSTGVVLSPYGPRFAQGATLVPRFLLLVEREQASPLGVGAGRTSVRSRRAAREKKPWKDLPSITGTVESQFVFPAYLGDNLMPFRLRKPFECVIPWDGKQLLAGSDERIDLHPGLAEWWRKAEATWTANRSSGRLDLRGRIDFRRGVSNQFPAPPLRVLYTASGMYLAAAILDDPLAVVDSKLYWGAVSGRDEGRFVTAVFNSDRFLQAVRPLQSRGEHNPRDFHKYPFELPLPLYDPSLSLHADLVGLAERAEGVVDALALDGGKSFESLRRKVRESLVEDGVSAELDDAVGDLLAGIPTGESPA